MAEEQERQEIRRSWIRELSCADPKILATVGNRFLQEFAPGVVELRRPEVGLTLVTGRVGGTGEPFGLGEMTVTRCVVQVGESVGVGYVRGRDTEHAWSVAVIDALLQGPHQAAVLAEVIEPLRRSRRDQEAVRTQMTEATRVQFLTMVRGN